MAMGANNKIEQIIDDIYEFVDNCKFQPLSQTKIVVQRDDFLDLLDELRLHLPEEIQRYQKIVANREKIEADAREKAAVIIEQAKAQAAEMVSEHEIYRQAYEHANQVVQDANFRADTMLNDAKKESEQLRAGALAYTNDILAEAERVISTAYEQARVSSENMLNTLKSNLDVVVMNRNELGEQLNPVDHRDLDEVTEADFEFDENTFLRDVQ